MYGWVEGSTEGAITGFSINCQRDYVQQNIEIKYTYQRTKHMTRQETGHKIIETETIVLIANGDIPTKHASCNPVLLSRYTHKEKGVIS